MNVIEATSIYEAWTRAASFLLDLPGRTDFNLILNISEPFAFDSCDQAIRSRFESFLAAQKMRSLDTIANTIFPYALYARMGIDGIFSYYPDVAFPKIKNKWGRYAYRLVRVVSTENKDDFVRDPDTNEAINPLEKIINRLGNYKKDPKRAIFELNTLDPIMDIPVYRSDHDSCYTMGGPCLSHISFKVINEKVCLTAFYRSHYYIERALGNLLGLSWLLYFVSEESGLPAGSITCHSSMAQIESNQNFKVDPMRKVITDCKGILEESGKEFVEWQRVAP